MVADRELCKRLTKAAGGRVCSQKPRLVIRIEMQGRASTRSRSAVSLGAGAAVTSDGNGEE